MTPMMRANIEKNINYHTAMRDYHKEAVAAAQPPAEESGSSSRSSRTAAPKPAQSSDEKLAAMHDDVVQQLRAVLDAAPIVSGIDMAMAQQQRPRRGLSRNLPTAGTLH